jgi:hypothetical protein
MSATYDDPILEQAARMGLLAKDGAVAVHMPEVDPFAEPTPEEAEEFKQNIEAEKFIPLVQAENEELLSGIDEEIKLPLVPVNASAVKKLEVLQQINETLVEIINSPEDRQTAPKFGSGVCVDILLQGKDTSVWVDQNMTDVDTGQVYNFDPATKNRLLQDIDKRRAEIASDKQTEYDRDKEGHEHYQMTEEDYELESEKDFPVYVLPKQPGPVWDDSILYGPAGRLIQKASSFNESHPAGMLVDFIVSLGSVIGRGPYFNISATKHFCNEFMARIGDSAKSRKGTGRDVIDQVLKMVDVKWYSDRIRGGFGSGEAIVNEIRDSTVEQRMNHKTGQMENKIIPGIDDKRLCIREGELANILVLASKTGERADVVLRDAWDSKPLRNIVKGKTKDGFSNSNKCEEPHVSISADTTIHELRQKMPVGADANGFGNRFLYVYVYRVKDCPQGSPELDWTDEIVLFQKIVQFARTVKHVSMTKRARQWWNNNYARLEHEGPDGLAGKMTTRGAAHVRRIAMLYALIDQRDQIDLEHFQAAEKLWSYCEESALFIFNGATREQLRILNWIENRSTAVTFNQIREELYSRNRKAVAIRSDLQQMVNAGQLASKNGLYVLSRNVGWLAAA